MTNLYRLFLVVVCLGASGWACAQTQPTVSGSFAGVPFEQFVKQVEAQTPYRFFYARRDVDSLQVRVQATNQPLAPVLNQVLAGTNLRFAIDQRQRVFITTDQAIRTELSPNFFDRGAGTGSGDTAAVEFGAVRDKARLSLETRVVEIGQRANAGRGGNATLAGRIRNATTGEPAVGVTVMLDKPRTGVVTDAYGYYSLPMPRGRHELTFRSIGLLDTKRQVVIWSDGKLDLDMDEVVVPLREVTINSRKDVNVASTQMGSERLDIKTIKQVPTVLGEADLIRVVLTLPGVKSVGEGTVGFNVRGGSAGQNLILFNDATIYNPSHLFGFFSAFNPDIIKSVDLYKSAIPARFGGRLSSVLDITTRDGNKKKWVGAGGVGPVTGRLTLEGPLITDKTSILIGGRTTYSDWLLRQLPNGTYNNGQAAFYDVNLGLTHEANDKNSFYLTAYLSRDQFKIGGDSLYTYQNQVISAKWKHVFSNKLYAVTTGTYSRYNYGVSSDKKPTEGFRFGFDIRQSGAKIDFAYFPNPAHVVDFGIGTTHYSLRPGNLQPTGEASLIQPTVVPNEQGLENAVYINDRFDVTPRLSINGGLRYSLFMNLGPSRVFTYAPNQARSERTITDTLQYGPGSTVSTNGGLEYRLGVRYLITDNLSVKASYNRMRQYLHMLSNTVAVSPLDIYKLSDTYLKPQVGDQYSLGFYQNLRASTIELSVEGYYRTLQNQLDFRSGGTLLLNQHLETDLVSAEGMAYGVEVMLKKQSGKLNGWLSYTYARSLLRTVTPYTAEAVNNGSYYPSSYDKPHDVTLIGNYKINRRLSISVNATYSTGRPITLPLARYVVDGTERVFYSERNQYRIPDYFRTDLSLNIEGNHKIRKLAHSSWTLGVYNLTGRRNAYSVYFTSANGRIRGYQLSIFGQPIPTLTYNFRF